MKKEFITEEQKEMYKKFLKQKDLVKVAEQAGYGLSSVNNIVHRLAKVNKTSVKIVKALNVATYARMMEAAKLISGEVKGFRELEEVKEYMQAKKQDKWI